MTELLLTNLFGRKLDVYRLGMADIDMAHIEIIHTYSHISFAGCSRHTALAGALLRLISFTQKVGKLIYKANR